MSERPVAYFCMEYGLNSEFHTYSGGLGVLAGDILKASKDLGENVVGVGLMWSKGYVEQFNCDDSVTHKYYSHNYSFVDKVHETQLKIGDQELTIDVYKTEKYGNAPLYLLDTNNLSNTFEQRQLTSKLYMGSQEEKMLQQVILGKGGLKVLEELGEFPEKVHMNESDSFFAGLEMIRRSTDGSFEEELEKNKEKVVFTTHTPIEAGNPKFSHGAIENSGVAKEYGEVDLRKLAEDPFNSTLACLRIAGKTNAVAERHETVAREMWSGFENTCEITGITNGVHLPTWQSEKVKGKTGEELWRAHQEEKKELIKVLNADLDPEKPLIGFARRFTDYKRPTLLLDNPEIEKEILENFNIVFAGKAHIEDVHGQKMVNRVYHKSLRDDSVVWIENYDMKDAERLIKGCDIWLSSPIPKKEACSTSVIKAAANGLLNVSTPDGWCWEAINSGENGWLYGNDEPEDNRVEQDRKDLEALKKVLVDEILPSYNDKNKWISMMERAIETSKEYSAKEMVKKYRERLWD